MNDKFIDDLLDKPIPEAEQNARKIAINSAMAEFSQGIEQSARPIENKPSIWSRIMRIFNHTYSNGAFATIAIAFIAVSVAFLVPHDQDSLVSQTPNSKSERFSADRIDVFDTSQEDQSFTPQVEAESDVSHYDSNSNVRAEAPVPSRPNIAPPSPALEEMVVTGSRASGAISPEQFAGAAAAEAKQVSRSRSLSQGIISNEPMSMPAPQRPDLDEEYAQHVENTVKLVSEQPVSTFSIDVDTAAYSLVRNQLLNGYLPSPTAVRSEELINYFKYDYPLPKGKTQPFETSISVYDSPWNAGKKLAHIGIQGYDLPAAKAPDSNLVFLLDVSGSMNAQNKLPLVKQSVGLLLDTLKPTDTVSIVVYAGAAGVVLEPTPAKQKSKILSSLQNLQAGGSTAGGQGIELAYQLAEQHFKEEGVNRIILATDGDFNVGLHSNEALKTLVERKRENGVFLSVLGFGRNNYQDDMMQTLAQNGNGVAAFIDSLSEAKKVLVDEATSTLFTIAKDVKIQVEFNPAEVSEYRLVGYETRHLNREDFNNDKVDAGDIGSGHSVTAIYELTPVDSKNASIDPLRYKDNEQSKPKSSTSSEYGFVKIRYKLPNENVSKLLEQAISKRTTEPSQDVLFSTAVAGFAQLLKGGKQTTNLDFDAVIKLAQQNKGEDPYGYRSEFIQLVGMAKIAK